MQSNKSVLHYLLDTDNCNPIERSQVKCVELVLNDRVLDDDIKRIINIQDTEGSVPLHYGTHFWNTKTILSLLTKGAMLSVGVANHSNEKSLKRISPEVSEIFKLHSYFSFFCLGKYQG